MKPLPSWTEAFSLVSEFFTHEHQAFGCFNPPTFMALLGQHYSGTGTDSPSWWVSLNAVIAIAQRRRAEAAQSAADEDLAWGYASNALAGTSEVLMRSTQLSSVQALLAVAWFFIGTPNPQPSFMLVGCAIRLGHSIGIHVDSQDPSLSPADKYLRKKVYGIATYMDLELCLRTGRPPCHNLNEVCIDPPGTSPDETEIVTTTGGLKVNLYNAQMQLSSIRGSIYREINPNEPSPTGTTKSISSLIEKLESWQTEFAPALDGKSTQTYEHHGLIRLYLAYCHTLIIVNRTHSFKYWASPELMNTSALPSTITSSIENCIRTSRCIIELTKLVSDKWKSFHWDTIPPLLSAVVILCINVIHNLVDQDTQNDMSLVSDSVQIIKTLDDVCPNTYLNQVWNICQKLYCKAQHSRRPSTIVSVEPTNPNNPASAVYPNTARSGHAPVPEDGEMSDYLQLDPVILDQLLPYRAPVLWDLETFL
ncbi:fungal-specific transcription factor [Fusarium venenatum]|uniref:fungal-specific transcription factor n=1 Tax=Fusarium venenatum TaxID=56646 RepID=UPI001D586B78|nr:fungal-specific transcription factor [Fusarium venenatum]